MRSRGRLTTSVIQDFADLKREYKADYDAADSRSRFRRTRHNLYGTADAHYSTERKYFEVIEYIRDMERNDTLVGPMLDIVCDQLNRGGFQYEPNTGDKSLDADLKADFAEWSSDPSAFCIAGDTDFRESELMVLRSKIRDGDIFVLPRESGHLQFQESERCRTASRSKRNIVHGVELDRETRRPVRYWFTKGLVDIQTRIESTNDMTAIDAFDDEGFPNVFHIRRRSRITQTRGVSSLTAAQLKLGMLEDVEFALVLKQQMAASVVFTEESKDGFPSTDGGGRRETVQGAGGDDYVTEEISPGQFRRLPPGKTLKVNSPQIPSTETLEHIRMIKQMVGLSVGLPVIVLLMDASETNFSGWRGAVDIARSLFRQGQVEQSTSYHRNVAIFRTRWVKESRRSLGKSLRNAEARGVPVFRHRWRLPSWPYVQPLHDAQARALKLSTLQSSPRREAADDGNDFAEIVAETIEDNEKAIGAAIEAAKRLNDKAGTDVVHWRDILNRDMYQGGSATDSVDVANGGKAEAKPKTK